jgi:diadenosine tetraphosphatase ApaH/serine/threonine PP2A family protein phosphatase
MKIALLADLHANLEASEECLAHARAAGAERYAFLGDLVGYGADPGPVVDLVADYVSRGAVAVLGNHDAAAIHGGAESMSDAAARAIAWTHARLSEGQRAFLAGLPLLVREDDLVLVHAGADAPAEWAYVTDPGAAARSLDAAAPAPYVFGGHVHEPRLFYTSAAARPVPFRPVPHVPIPVPRHRRWLALVGATGQPRDGNPAASYALMDLGAATLTFFRVPYDVAAAAGKIRAAGLPASLAARLERGE